MNNLSHMFHCFRAEALASLIDLQSYKSWRFATKVFWSFLFLHFFFNPNPNPNKDKVFFSS